MPTLNLSRSLLAALAGVLLLWWNPLPFASLLAVIIAGFAIAPAPVGAMAPTIERQFSCPVLTDLQFRPGSEATRLPNPPVASPDSAPLPAESAG